MANFALINNTSALSSEHIKTAKSCRQIAEPATSNFAEVMQQVSGKSFATHTGEAKNDIATDATSAQDRSVIDEFMEWMQMSPAQKIRACILKELGLTEEQLRELPPEEQEKIEALIEQRIRDELKLKNS